MGRLRGNEEHKGTTDGTGKGSRRGRKEEGKVDRKGEGRESEGRESEGRESTEGWQIKN